MSCEELSSLSTRFDQIEKSIHSLERTFAHLFDAHLQNRLHRYRGSTESFHPQHYKKPMIILFYKYFRIDSEKLYQKQQSIYNSCLELGLEGKMRMAPEGINGTFAGEKEDLESFIHILHSLFSDEIHQQAECLEHKRLTQPIYQYDSIDIKWYKGQARGNFPGLSVRVTKELCTLNLQSPWTPSEEGGIHTDAQTFHKMVKEKMENKDSNIVLIDCRNDYEWALGRFPSAICPPTRSFADFPKYIEENADGMKGKRVLMYCTGGIRCERASSFVKSQAGISEVYQLQGGIIRYVEALGKESLFQGRNFVFDSLNQGIETPGSESVAKCALCFEECASRQRFCSTAGCRAYIIACDSCVKERDNLVYCSPQCREHGLSKQGDKSK